MRSDCVHLAEHLAMSLDVINICKVSLIWHQDLQRQLNEKQLMLALQRIQTLLYESNPSCHSFSCYDFRQVSDLSECRMEKNVCLVDWLQRIVDRYMWSSWHRAWHTSDTGFMIIFTANYWTFLIGTLFTWVSQFTLATAPCGGYFSFCSIVYKKKQSLQEKCNLFWMTQ